MPTSEDLARVISCLEVGKRRDVTDCLAESWDDNLYWAIQLPGEEPEPPAAPPTYASLLQRASELPPWRTAEGPKRAELDEAYRREFVQPLIERAEREPDEIAKFRRIAQAELVRIAREMLPRNLSQRSATSGSYQDLKAFQGVIDQVLRLEKGRR